MDASLETDDPSLSTPSDTSPPSDLSPPTTPDASPPAAETPPELPPPSSPPPSSPPPSSPPPVDQSPPSSPPPSPPSESQPPPDSSSPPPSTPVPSFSPPPTNNDSPSPPAEVTPTTPVTNPSQPTPVFSSPSPPSSNNSPSQPAPNGRVSPSLPDAPSPPKHSQGASRPTSSSSSPLSNSNSRDATVLIVGVVVGGVLILALLVVCLLWNKRKKKQPYYSDPRHPPMGGDQYWNSRKPNDHVVKLPPPQGASWGTPPGTNSSDFGSYSGQNRPGFGPPSPNVGGGMMGGYNQSQFTYEELAAATGGFAQSNLLGQGGFGYVHKGVLPNDRQVAVKSLKAGSGQGEREFQAEVEIISRVHHRHLVSLVGYCISDKQRMLVYEYVPNSTLEFHLHGKGQPVMDWPTRMRIALGSAKGLAYLHEDCNPRIIHRDIKSANILLDDNYEAMVADFGLAKLTTDNSTHVSTRVMGTFGYLAPEYASSGKLTEKSDVFSFGIMLLELITGRRPVDPTNKTMEDGLVDWARQLIPKALEEDEFSELVDPRLEANYNHHEMARMIACASACIRHSARRRPKMSQIIRALDGNSSLDDLNDVPKRSPSTISPSGNETMAYNTGMYNADMMKFRKMVLPSQEFNASEDGGGTSEYGLNPSSSSSDEFGSKQQQQQQMKKPY